MGAVVSSWGTSWLSSWLDSWGPVSIDPNAMRGSASFVITTSGTLSNGGIDPPEPPGGISDWLIRARRRLRR